MSHPLPPYDKDATCQRCGFGPCLTEFHEALNVTPMPMNDLDPLERRCLVTTGGQITPPGQMRPVEWPAHLHRTCPNCRGDWAEATLESTGRQALLGAPSAIAVDASADEKARELARMFERNPLSELTKAPSRGMSESQVVTFLLLQFRLDLASTFMANRSERNRYERALKQIAVGSGPLSEIAATALKGMPA